MPQNRIILLLFFFFASTTFAQKNEKVARQEIYALICEADGLLNDLKFSESLEVSKKALNMAYHYNQNDYIAMAYNTIAGCHEDLSEIDKALNYYEKALVFANKSKNDTVKDWINNNIGNVHNFDKKNYRESITYYKKSLAYSEKLRDTAEILYTKLNLTSAYLNLNDPESGLIHLKFIENNLKKFGDKESAVIFYTLNGVYFSQINQPKKARYNFQFAIELGKKSGQKISLSDAYEAYSKFLYDLGDFKNAYEARKNFEQIKDEIVKGDKLKSAQVSGIKIELDESRREISKIESEKMLQTRNLQHSKVIVILCMAMIVVVLLLAHTFYRNSIYRKKINNELVEKNLQLEIAKDKAEESSILKSQFISTVSHELRTPLYGVIGITDMILDEHKQLENSPHINSLKFSAKYLLSLVNDLLQIHKIEDRKIILEEIPLCIQDEIEKVKHALQFIAHKNNNEISIEIDAEIPEMLIGDKRRFSQILMNLMSNALKFTKNGRIEVLARHAKKSGNLHWIDFSVEDNGCGIAPENQTKIFEKFVQIDRSEGDYQGTGLGLSIVKRLLEIMGSQVRLQSEEHKGTKISFSLSFEHNPEMVEKFLADLEVDMSVPASYRILVVEDNKINQMVTRKIIEKNNYTCEVVDDGFAALKILQTQDFDLVLMDINMPQINGFETTKRIRERNLKIPVIALTAYDKEEIYEEAKSCGMNDILIKPFENVQLFQMISNYIAKNKSI